MKKLIITVCYIILKLCALNRQNFLLYILLLGFILPGNAFGFDVGPFLESPGKSIWHLEMLSIEKKRRFKLKSRNKTFLDELGITKRSKDAHAHVLVLRSTFLIHKRLSFAIEGGLFNDLKPQSGASSFVGVQGKILLVNTRPLKIVPFATSHHVRSFHYAYSTTRVDELEPLAIAKLKSNFERFSGGILLSTSSLALGEVQVTPHLGWEYSTLNSGRVRMLKLGLEEKLLEGQKLTLKAKDHNSAIFGLNFTRQGYSTVRLETRYSTVLSSISLSFGFWL